MAKENPKEIDRLRKALSKELNWGAAGQWHSSMFTELSEKIFEKTQINISPPTLKRFFNVVNHSGTPSVTTLDALTQFLGFDNWRHFKQNKKKPNLSFGKAVPYQSLYVAFGFVLAIVMITFIANQIPNEVILPEGITFTSKTLTTTYPNSVVFDFDLKGVQTDSLRIQQYWDPKRTISIKKDQNQATGIYYFPGYFKAKLLVEGKVVSKHDLFLRSNGWLGMIEYKPVPKYFTPLTPVDGFLSYPQTLSTEIYDANKPLVTAYHYINDLGNISGDNFKLKATLESTFGDKWAVCQSSWLYIIGTDGAMIIPFSKIGCSADNNLMLNDFYLKGRDHDLSNFAADLSTPTAIEISNDDQLVRVSINGKEVYVGQYQETMGRFVGLRFKFLGMGEVKSFSLFDQNGNAVVL